MDHKVNNFYEFVNESSLHETNITDLFKGAHAAIQRDKLVPLKDMIGKPDFPSKEEFDTAVEYLGIDGDYLFYDKTNPIDPIAYLKGPIYIGFMGLRMDILKMLHSKERIEQKQKFVDATIADKDYNSLFQRIDKKVLIPVFVDMYQDIPDDQKYDVFTALYTRSEYGFNMFPKDLMKDLFTKRKLSKEWKERMEDFNKEHGKEDTITIYRGQNSESTKETEAFSWTLSKKTADFFANRFSTGKILTRKIKSDDVIDFLDGRNEAEVIVDPNKIIKESESFFRERRVKLFEDFEEEPVALTILGTPGGGKSHLRRFMSKMKELINIVRATDPGIGVDLTVDVLRGKILEMPAKDQLDLFYTAFYTLKELSDDNKEYVKWFDDIKRTWSDKISKMTELSIEVTDKDLIINKKTGEDALKELQKDADKIIDGLDKYADYKRIVRAYQHIKEKEAEGNKKDVVYDEVGDEPEKIINKLEKLHKKDYVTDVIMIHHDEVSNNLLQNAYRMIVGSDGGRDSSEGIIDAYSNIDKNLDMYKKNAEVSVSTTTKELLAGEGPAVKALTTATAKDNDEMGNKPIDVLVRTKGDQPKDSYDRILKDLDEEGKKVLKALLKYQTESPKINIPEKPKKTLIGLIGDISNEESLKILIDANAGKLKKSYVFKSGGISDKLIVDAREILGNDDSKNENENIAKPTIIYVDMDGVLTDFDKGIYEIVARFGSDTKLRESLSKEDQTNLEVIHDILMTEKDSGVRMVLKNSDYKNTVRAMIYLDPKWWETLSWMPDGEKLWGYLKKLNVEVLTSSFGHTNSSAGKKKWVADHLGPTVKMTIIDDKEDLARPDALLIDDRRQIVDLFADAGGQIILHTSAAETISELKKIMSVHVNE